jgi:HTH-type transcriptional regulator/antitoxin HigA
MIQQSFPMKSEAGYQKAVTRYEEIRNAAKGSSEQKQKLSLAFFINQYEEKEWSLHLPDIAELSRIRKEDFGYPAH